MVININREDFDINVNLTHFNLLKQLIDKLIEIFNTYYTDKIIVNGNIATVLSDSELFVHQNIQKILSVSDKPYYYGYINNNLNKIEVFVDPYLKWDDNRIIMVHNDTFLRNLKIKKILNYNNTIEFKTNNEIIIDKNIMDFLS